MSRMNRKRENSRIRQTVIGTIFEFKYPKGAQDFDPLFEHTFIQREKSAGTSVHAVDARRALQPQSQLEARSPGPKSVLDFTEMRG